MDMNTLPVELHGEFNAVSISTVLNRLQNLPEEINKIGADLDTIEKGIIEATKEINKAKKNLEVAEATAISFPDRLLKNEAERKAYVVEKTQTELDLIVSLENKKLFFTSSKLDVDREYRRLINMFDAAKHAATLMNGVMHFLIAS